MALEKKFRNFEEFWLFYLAQHSHPFTKNIHVTSTLVAIGFVAFAIALRRLSWIPLGIALGYGPAWVSHWLFQKNQPATFHHPWWSFRASLRLVRKTVF